MRSPVFLRRWRAATVVAVAATTSLGACTPSPGSGASRPADTKPTPDARTGPVLGSEPASTVPPAGDGGDGGAPDGSDAAPVTVPAGVAGPTEIVAALEAQRADRPIALYWRHLLLHGTPLDAYLYINDRSRTDLDPGLRSRAVEDALAALKLTETWHTGQPRPQLPDFDSIAWELTTRNRVAIGVDVLAANAARSTEGSQRIEVLIVYRPVFADGSSDRTNRLVVVMDSGLDISNGYLF